MAKSGSAHSCTGCLGVCLDNGYGGCGGVMVKPKRVSQEPTLLDLYAAMASVGVLQRYGFDPLPAFIADKSFELAQAMLEKRSEILEKKDE